MGDGNGECCIARWGDSHVTSGYNTSKMDMIMLKFRPIAPKPVSGNIAVGEAASQSNNGGRHAKGATGSGRGRRKSNSKENNNNSNNNNSTGGSGSGSSNRRCNNNGRKRKSSSPDHQKNDEKTDLTLLPLFPEAPDLSPKNNNQVHNDNNNSNMPFSLNFNFDDQIVSSTSFSFENNYNQCHSSWW